MPLPKDPIKAEETRRKMSEANLGKHLSEETRRKISESLKGRTLSEEHRKRVSESLKGRTYSEESRMRMSESGKKRAPISEETREKMRVANSGRPSSMKGKHHTDEARKRMSAFQKGKIFSEEYRKKLSMAQKGKHLSKETKLKLSRYCGPLASGWNGGVSFEPYCVKFNREFKERVRAFFGYVCIECGTPQGDKKLHIHHVLFNKNTCCDQSIPLFVPLCHSCHSKTHWDREFWIEHFTEMINGYYGGKCYFTKEEMEQYTFIADGTILRR